MNLTWHIVKKDLRALRWPLVLWIGLIVAKLGLGVALLTTNGVGGSEFLLNLEHLAALLAVLECGGVVLVAVLIQEDLLVGTTAFWATRPISGARLLAAKLLALGLIFGVLPVVVTLPWWLGCHLGLRDIVWVATETAVLHFVIVLLGILLAVVTDGLGRFMMWTLALVAAIPLAGASILSYYNRVNAVVHADLASTRSLVVAAILLAGVAVVVVHQFLTRRVWRSVSVIVGTLGLAVAVALWWPWAWHIDAGWNNWLARRAEATWPVGAEPAGLKFTVTKADLKRYPGPRVDRPSQLLLNYHVDGLPENQALLPAIGNYTLRWADATTSEGWSWGRSAWYEAVSLQALHLPTDKIKDMGMAQFTQLLRADVASRLLREPTALSLQARFALVETEGTTHVLLAPGKLVTVGSLGERIGFVEKEGEEVLVTFVRHRPLSARDFMAGMGSYMLGFAGTSWPSQYLLVNPATKRVDRGVFRLSRTTRIAGVEISWETKAYRAMPAVELTPEQRAEQVRQLLKQGLAVPATAKPRWEALKALDEAQFMRVSFQSKGNFSHQLTADPLEVSSIEN